MRPEANPTARAPWALELGNPGITAEQLAARLGVSDRAARRYVATLLEAGIPIESARGHHDAGDPTDPIGNALGTLLRALPEPVAAQAEAVRRRAAPAVDRSAARPDPATTTALVQACSDRRRVRLGYRSEAGTEGVTEVDPWAVVVRHGRGYLLCHLPSAGARRAYRIDRVRGRAARAARRRPGRPGPGGRAGGAPRRRLGVRVRGARRRPARGGRALRAALARPAGGRRRRLLAAAAAD